MKYFSSIPKRCFIGFIFPTIIIFVGMITWSLGYLGINTFINKTLTVPNQDIGKIKFVNADGQEVMVNSCSLSSIVFPMSVCTVNIENGIATLEGSEFDIIISPIEGVVSSVDDSTKSVTISNGEIDSVITGMSVIAVNVNDYVMQGQSIGTTCKPITFKVFSQDNQVDLSQVVEQ